MDHPNFAIAYFAALDRDHAVASWDRPNHLFARQNPLSLFYPSYTYPHVTGFWYNFFPRLMMPSLWSAARKYQLGVKSIVINMAIGITRHFYSDTINDMMEESLTLIWHKLMHEFGDALPFAAPYTDFHQVVQCHAMTSFEMNFINSIVCLLKSGGPFLGFACEIPEQLLVNERAYQLCVDRVKAQLYSNLRTFFAIMESNCPVSLRAYSKFKQAILKLNPTRATPETADAIRDYNRLSMYQPSQLQTGKNRRALRKLALVSTYQSSSLERSSRARSPS
eukprot:GEZU01017112.1.p1 GENE.GEZU01017112.1~~GEZU01017112.1.p1  ORF type:complete len:279 (+),score=51.40 GEZU01017112.1:797-1633(+)